MIGTVIFIVCNINTGNYKKIYDELHKKVDRDGSVIMVDFFGDF